MKWESHKWNFSVWDTSITCIPSYHLFIFLIMSLRTNMISLWSSKPTRMILVLFILFASIQDCGEKLIQSLNNFTFMSTKTIFQYQQKIANSVEFYYPFLLNAYKQYYSAMDNDVFAHFFYWFFRERSWCFLWQIHSKPFLYIAACIDLYSLGKFDSYS